MGEVAVLTTASRRIDLFLPAVRFAGAAWLVAASTCLPLPAATGSKQTEQRRRRPAEDQPRRFCSIGGRSSGFALEPLAEGRVDGKVVLANTMIAGILQTSWSARWVGRVSRLCLPAPVMCTELGPDPASRATYSRASASIEGD